MQELQATRALRTSVLVALAMVLLVTGAVATAPERDAAAATYQPLAGERAFALRYSTNTNGQITIAANTIVKCPVDTSDAAANSACNASRNGTNARNNNSYDMQWLDYDSDASTFNSSKADLILPAGGSVLFAGLYWTGVPVKGDVITFANGSKGVPQPAPNASLVGQVKFRVPGSSTYGTVNATTIDTGPISLGSGFGAFADVTSLVSAAGAGSYYVGNVQSGTGGNTFGGWSLVVAYSDQAEPLRNLSVFDGLKVVGGSSSFTVPLSGFKTPASGTVNTTIGVVAAEGDAGATGDYLMVNNNRLTDAVHPANNTENSTIANRGAHVTTKGPDWRNQLGYDASLFAADGFLPNNATTASFTAQTTGDTYAPQAITFATQLYEPQVTLTKTVDVSDPEPSEEVTYTITATNSSGTTSALNAEIFDYIPGGMELSATPTTSVGGATVWCNPSCGTLSAVDSVGVRLGTLAPNSTATFTVKMVVKDDRPLGEVIDNTATLDFVAPDLGLPVSKVASVPVTVAYPDPAVAKTVVGSPTGTGPYTYTFAVDVTNVGSLPTLGPIDVDDAIGAGGTITAMSGTGWSCTAPSCNYGSTLAPGASAPTLTVTATFPAQTNVVNTATLGTAKGGQPSAANGPATLNDSATAAAGVSPYSILTVNKAAVLPEVGIGGTAQFRIRSYNQGPFAATNATLVDTVPAGLEVESVTVTQGTCTTVENQNGTTTVTCAAGALAVASAFDTVITVRPLASATGTAVTNNVTLTSDNTVNPATDAAALNVRAAVDLSVVKSADRETAQPNDTIGYTVTVTNNGPIAAPEVSVTDSLPDAIVSATATATGGGTCTASAVVVDCTWSGTSLAVGASVSVTIAATVKSSFDPSSEADVLSKRAVNIVQVMSALDEIDPADNQDDVMVKILPYGDVAANATGPGVVAPGSSATLTFVGSNNGPTTATSTVMTIEIQPGLVIESVPGICSTSGTTVTCALGTLVEGESTPVDVVVRAPVDSAGLAYLSTVAIDSAVDDPVPENNSDLTPLYSTLPPSIVSVTPSEGPVEGGTQVTIDGDNLTSDITVEIGGVPCTPVWFNTAQQIVCTTGPHPPGVVDVVVRTVDGQTFTFVGGFTYIGGPIPDPIVPRYAG